MTKEEAIKAVNEGKKVTHCYFTDNEFIKMENGNVVDEKGNILPNFWFFRKAEHWSSGWSIFDKS